MRKDLISIVVPTNNRSRLLLDCLSSLSKQSYAHKEIVIVDDGSTDDTEELVKKFIKESDTSIKYKKISRCHNIAKLRNIGIETCDGEFIAFCDDDDLWNEYKLEIQVKFMNRYKFVCCNAKVVNFSGLEIIDKYYDFNCDNIIRTEDLLFRNYVLTPTVLINRELINYAKFDEESFKNLAEDYELWLKYSLKYDLYFLNKKLVTIRRHDRNTSHDNINRLSLIKNELKLVSDFEDSTNLKHRKAATIGAQSFRLEIFDWFIINGSLFNALLQLISILTKSLKPHVAMYTTKEIFYRVRSLICKRILKNNE